MESHQLGVECRRYSAIVECDGEVHEVDLGRSVAEDPLFMLPLIYQVTDLSGTSYLKKVMEHSVIPFPTLIVDNIPLYGILVA